MSLRSLDKFTCKSNYKSDIKIFQVKIQQAFRKENGRESKVKKSVSLSLNSINRFCTFNVHHNG